MAHFLSSAWLSFRIARTWRAMNSPKPVSRLVSNPCMRHWQRWGVKPGVMSKAMLSHQAEPG